MNGGWIIIIVWLVTMQVAHMYVIGGALRRIEKLEKELEARR